jgi:hypothetical protein
MHARFLSLLILVSLTACKPASNSSTPEIEEQPPAKVEAATAPAASTTKPKTDQNTKRSDHPTLDQQTAQGVQFSLSNYSTNAREQDGSFTHRASRELMPDERQRLQVALQQLREGKLHARELKALLESFTDVASTELIALAAELMKHSEAATRGKALALFAGMSDQEVLPLVKQALTDADASVRLQAAELLTYVQSPELQPLLYKGLQDADANVRLVTFQTALRQPSKQRQELIQAAVTQPHPDLAQAAIDTLEGEPSKQGITILMKGLDHADPFIKEKSRDIIALTLGEIFENAAAAQSWWQKSHFHFDEDLVQKTE